MTKFFTIGYEGSKIEDFLHTLVLNQIDTLVDIRDFPGSRRKGFSKSALKEHLASVGIKYKHVKALGDPKEGRDAARAGKYNEFRSIFCRHMQGEAATLALNELMDDIENQTICLLCYERDPMTCHRKIVSDMICNQRDSSVVHLGVQVKDAKFFRSAPDRKGAYCCQI